MCGREEGNEAGSKQVHGGGREGERASDWPIRNAINCEVATGHPGQARPYLRLAA